MQEACWKGSQYYPLQPDDRRFQKAGRGATLRARTKPDGMGPTECALSRYYLYYSANPGTTATVEDSGQVTPELLKSFQGEPSKGAGINNPNAVLLRTSSDLVHWSTPKREYPGSEITRPRPCLCGGGQEDNAYEEGARHLFGRRHFDERARPEA